MAKILALSCSIDPYETNAPPAKPRTNDLPLPMMPMVQWSPQHWEGLAKLIVQVRTMIGKDKPEKENASDAKRLDLVLRCILVQRSIASLLRWSIEEQIRNPIHPDIQPKINSTAAEEFIVYVTDGADDEQVQAALESLLVSPTQKSPPSSQEQEDRVLSLSSSARQEKTFRTLEEWGEILSKKPFALEYMQRKIDTLISFWVQDCFPDVVARIEEDGDQTDNEDDVLFCIQQDASPVTDEDDDNNNNNNLNAEEDEENEERKPPAKREKRAAASAAFARIQVMEGDDDDDSKAGRKDDDYVYATGLKQEKDVREEKQVKKTNIRSRLSDERSLLNNKGKRKRFPFTEEEKEAIRKGVRQFGVGKWSQIKCEFSMELRWRTAVNIKDCYRTLMKKGEA